MGLSCLWNCGLNSNPPRGVKEIFLESGCPAYMCFVDLALSFPWGMVPKKSVVPEILVIVFMFLYTKARAISAFSVYIWSFSQCGLDSARAASSSWSCFWCFVLPGSQGTDARKIGSLKVTDQFWQLCNFIDIFKSWPSAFPEVVCSREWSSLEVSQLLQFW